jgi:hypothetical protein
VKERRALWSSLRALPRGAGSVVIQVEASLVNGTPRTDWYGIGCIASSEAAYLFGISPDGYYTIAFDSAASEDIQLERLVEDYADGAFGPAREPNRLRAECLHENGQNRLRLSVNGRRLVERTHRSRIGPFAGVELFVYFGARPYRRPLRRPHRTRADRLAPAGGWLRLARLDARRRTRLTSRCAGVG